MLVTFDHHSNPIVVIVRGDHFIDIDMRVLLEGAGFKIACMDIARPSWFRYNGMRVFGF